MENNTTTPTAVTYTPNPIAVFAGNVISVSIASAAFSGACYLAAGCIIGIRDLMRGRTEAWEHEFKAKAYADAKAKAEAEAKKRA